MNRLTPWLWTARVAQALLGFGSMGCLIGSVNSYSDYQNTYYPDDTPALYISIILSAGIALFAVFGVFAISNRVRETKLLYLLVLFIDLWAMVLSIAAGVINTLLWINWEDDSEFDLLVIASVCALTCIPVIFPLIVRTLHLWRKGMLDQGRTGAPNSVNVEPYEVPAQQYGQYHAPPPAEFYVQPYSTPVAPNPAVQYPPQRDRTKRTSNSTVQSLGDASVSSLQKEV